jgi:hypothetical protein
LQKKKINLRKTEDTRVGDLGLNKGSRVQLELGTNFKSNGIRALGIPSSLTGSFEIAVDTVVVRGSILTQVVGGVNGNTIFKSRVTKGSVIATDLDVIDVGVLTHKVSLVLILPCHPKRCRQLRHQQGNRFDQRQS